MCRHHFNKCLKWIDPHIFIQWTFSLFFFFFFLFQKCLPFLMTDLRLQLLWMDTMQQRFEYVVEYPENKLIKILPLVENIIFNEIRKKCNNQQIFCKMPIWKQKKKNFFFLLSSVCFVLVLIESIRLESWSKSNDRLTVHH